MDPQLRDYFTKVNKAIKEHYDNAPNMATQTHLSYSQAWRCLIFGIETLPWEDREIIMRSLGYEPA